MKKYGFGARGWVLVIYGLLCIALASAIPGTIQVALGEYVAKGFDSTHMLSLMTYGSLGTLIFLFILNFFSAKGKVSYRKLGLILGVLWAVLTALWGVMPTQASFTVIYIASFLCCQAVVLVVVNSLVANWFPTRKGTVIGIVTIGFTLGAMVGMMTFGGIMAAFGFVGSYVFLAVLVLIVTLVGYFVLRDYPEEVGCYPDNDRNMTREQAVQLMEEGLKLSANSPWTQKRVLGTWQMWCIALCCGIMMLFSSVVSSQLLVRIIAAGYPQQQATMMFSASMIIGMIGSWLIGVLDNKIGTRTSCIIMMAGMAVACVFTTLNSTVLMWIALALLGVELGGSSNYTTSLTVRYWGRYNFQRVYGVIIIITQIIGAFGAVFASTTSAKWGYNVTYLIMAGLSVVAILLLLPIRDDFVAKREAQFK